MIAIQKVHSFTDALKYNDKKLNLRDDSQRAELLDHNFLDPSKEAVLKEIKMINGLHTNRMKNDGYHVALSFSKNDTVSDHTLKAIADDYKKGMGFSDDHLFLLYKHNDGDGHEHTHMHLLLHRLAISASTGKTVLVSDSNNFQRSEKLCREIERKYDLEAVKSSKEALDRAPNKDELEMIQRTGELSERILMQEKVRLALSKSTNLNEFISNCGKQGIYLLFNQSKTTGLISGITYISSSNFIINASKLGNQYKFSNIKDQLNYEQSADRQTIGETNDRTRTKFKELLERGSRGNENSHSGTVRTPTGNFEKSAGLESKDESIFENRKESRFESDSARIDRHEEPEQEVEESFSNGIFASTGAIIGGVAGMLGSISPDSVNEDEKRRKRKIKR